MHVSLRFGKRIIPVWLILLAMIGTGSMVIAMQGVPPDQKLMIEEDIKPRADSFAFTGIPVEFDKDNDVTLDVTGAVSTGTKILTGQKFRFNIMTDVGEEVTMTIPLLNHSSDPQIVLFGCAAPEQVILDVDVPAADAGIDSVRLNAQNSWLINVNADSAPADPDDDTVGNMELDIATEHVGAYSVTCQLLAVG